MMTSQFKKLPIKTKLILVQVMIVFLVLVLNGVYQSYISMKEHRKTLISQLELAAGMISVNTAASLMFSDQGAAEDTLSSLKTESNMVNAWIYDTDKNLFATFSKNGFESYHFPYLDDTTTEERNGFLTVSASITLEKEVFGTLFIRADMTRYRAAVRNSIYLVVVGLLVGMLVALMFSIYSQRLIVRPILRLVNAFKSLNDDREYATRVHKFANDELGALYDSFNEMMHRLETRKTQRDDAEKALVKSQAGLLEAQRIAKLGNWEYEIGTGKIWWSRQLYELFELEDHEIDEERYFSMVHPDDRGWVRVTMGQAVAMGQSLPMEYRIVTASGQVKHVFDTGSEFRDDSGRVVSLYGAIQDITERKHVEEKVRRLNEELEQRVIDRTRELVVAKRRAEESDRLKSAFLATMSHELRTPLNSIIGFTGIMLQGIVGPLNDEQSKQLGMVMSSARHLLSLINDVLDISKIEAGQLEVELRTFDLRQSLEHVLRTLRPLADKKGLQLELEIAEDVGTFHSDQRRIEQILINLVNNAIKFTEEGGVIVRARSEGEHVTLSVEDTGIGIREDSIPKLFAPFQQIDIGLSRRYEGTGLGLSICSKLLDLLGGRISVESRWQKGSTFTVMIPDHGVKKDEPIDISD